VKDRNKKSLKKVKKKKKVERNASMRMND